MHKRTFLAFILLLSGLGIYAQGTWSLKECIDYGLKNHTSVKIYNDQKSVADQQARQALSTYLPQVNVNGSFDDNIKRQTTILPAGTFGSDKPIALTFGTKYNSAFSAQLTQTIYDQASLTGLKASKPNKDLAELQSQQNNEDIIYNISRAYYQIQLSNAQLSILHNNRDMYGKLLPIMELQADKGVTPRIEVDKIKVNLNNTEAQIMSAEYVIKQSLSTLKYQMGYAGDEDLVLDEREIDKDALLPEANTAFDYSRQTTYKIQQTNMLLQDIDARHIKAGALPKLSFYANYGIQAQNNDFARLYGQVFDYSAIGLKLSVPIFDGFSRNSQYNQAKLNMNIAAERLKLNQATAKNQYDNARTQLLQTQQSIETNKRNIELAQKVFNTTTLQYQKGINPLSEVLNADQSLKEAQINYINNLVNYYQARLDIEKSNGTLAGFYNSLK